MNITVKKKVISPKQVTEIRLSLSHLSSLASLSNHDENESCALIFGTIKENHAEVKDIVPMNERAERSVVHFSMDPLEAFKEIEKAENEGLELVAIFHSHPGKGIPAPSGTDQTFMRYWPVVWLISNKGLGTQFVVKGYMLNADDQTVREIPVSVENGKDQ